MSEKLSEQVTDIVNDALACALGSVEIADLVKKVVALEQQLAAEQAAHDQIATICFKAGAETKDGTSVSAVLSLADIVIDLQQSVAAKEHVIAGQQKEFHEVEQVLGQALGYPWYKDDQKNFPGSTEVDGVCVGEHTPSSIAIEAASRLSAKDAEIARLRSLLVPREENPMYVNGHRVYIINADKWDAALAETPAAPAMHDSQVCICNKPENHGKDIKCPAHGNQRPDEMCPLCKTHVLGRCPQGEYCTSDDCRYYC